MVKKVGRILAGTVLLMVTIPIVMKLAEAFKPKPPEEKPPEEKPPEEVPTEEIKAAITGLEII